MKKNQVLQDQNRRCKICGIALCKDNTKPYRIKNYIYKCNDCSREEKRIQARERYCSDVAKRCKKHKDKLKKENPIKYTCIQMRASAKKRSIAYGLDFNIDTEFLESIAPKTCPILGGFIKYGGGDKTNYSASLDRIDSKKGYTKDNVWIISNIANMMKNNADDVELKLFANWVLSREK